MPIYEYQCESCDHKLEIIQKINDAPLANCPACGNDSLRKLVSAAAFHLKGTGWYATDFKDKPKPTEDTKKAADSGGKSEESKDKTTSDTSKPSDKKAKSTTSK